MKKTLRYLSAFMAILMVMQIFGVSGFAFDSKPLTQNEWQERYDTFITSNTLPLLCVGRDQTELNLTWHAAKESAFPELKLSENENMEAADRCCTFGNMRFKRRPCGRLCEGFQHGIR